MLALLQLLGGFRGIIVGVAAAALAWGGLTLHHTLFVHPGIHRAGVAEGKATERLAWETQVAILRKALEDERRAAQAEIDKIESDYLSQRDKDIAALLDLQETIQAMEAEDAKNPDAGGRAVLPKRLSQSLNKIGR